MQPRESEPIDPPDERDEEAFDAFLTALERGTAPRVDAFLGSYPGAGDALRARLERLSDRLGSGVGRPERIGPYVVRGLLGVGGMGEVLLAEDPALERAVAIKVLPPSLARNPSRLARLRAEARTLAALDHPNVATVFGLGADAEEAPYIVMERVEGEDLAKRLQRGALAVPEALAVARQVASALEAAHERGIIHRDLKPSNVMLRPDGRVKVLDFGLAERIRTGARQDAGDAVAGTPGYMSPEQALGLEQDARADVWAFGSVLHECVTGRRVQSLSSGALRAGEAPRISDFPVDAPPQLAELAAACLASDRSLRPLDGGALVRALAALGEGERASERKRRPLPPARTRFIGRERERERLATLLAESAIVTVVGPGGVGKSRLALEVARDWASEAALADLAAVTRADELGGALLRAAGLREEVRRDVAESFAQHFESKDLLLVADNCERWLDATARLAASVLAACPRVRILATSREPLGLSGERALVLAPLPLPDADADEAAARECDAVRLFIDRMQRTAPEDHAVTLDVAAVASACRRLDGLPLALELGAARAATLGLATFVEHLRDRFRLLVGGHRDAHEHHRTLQALVDWSHDMLAPGECVLLRRLSIFVDGWTLASAEAVVADERLPREDVLHLIAQLASRSLVTRDAEGRRWRFLETLRDYAGEKLREAGEHEEWVRRHASHFIDSAERQAEDCRGAERVTAFLALEAERADLHAAFAACWAREDLAARAFVVAGRLVEFWVARGWLRDGQRELRAAATRRERHGPAEAARVLLALGTVEHRMGNYDDARTAYGEALAAARAIDDEELVALAERGLGFLSAHSEAYEDADRYLESALARQRARGDSDRVAGLLNDLGVLALFERRFDDAALRFAESLALHTARGSRFGIAGSLGNLGEANHRRGRLDEARAQLATSLEIFFALGDLRCAAESFEMSASLEASAGRAERAARLAGVAGGLRRRFGFPQPKAEEGPYAADWEKLRATLGEARMAELHAEGAAWDVAAAVRFATETDGQALRASSS